MQGSTVTYKVVSDRGYSVIWGVRFGSERMLSIASSSACISKLVGSVSSPGDNGAVSDKNAANRDFTGCEGFLCLGRYQKIRSGIAGSLTTIVMACRIQV